MENIKASYKHMLYMEHSEDSMLIISNEDTET